MSKPKTDDPGLSKSPKRQESKQKAQTDNSGEAKQQRQDAISMITNKEIREVGDSCSGSNSNEFDNYIHYNKLATLSRKEGNLTKAIDFYKKALKLKPDFVTGYFQLGILYQMQSKLLKAINCYNRAIQIKPNFPEAYFNRGSALQKQGNLAAAINSYKTAIQYKSDFPEANINLGLAHQTLGNLSEAIAYYNTAIQLKPGSAKAHFNLGIAQQKQGNISQAITSYHKALKYNPNFIEAYTNLGNALQIRGELSAATNAYTTALRLNPNYAEAHYNLGIALQEQGNLSSAIDSYLKATHINPKYVEAHNNLGNAYQIQGDLSAAIQAYTRAIQLKPNIPEPHKNLSYCLLQQENFSSGWDEYEWRLKTKNQSLDAIPKCQQWDGGKQGKHQPLLLVSEQGLGDTIQFMRYTNTLKDKGFSVSLCAPPKLHSLIKVSGIDSSPLTPNQANKITEGKWIPLLSIPRFLKINRSNPIINYPYISTTDKLQRKWKNIFSTEQRPIIGINWQGNPKTEKTGLLGRSLSLETFAPIIKHNQISLLSLQKGFGSEQLNNCSFKETFVNCQDHVNATWDFLETAAMIANCDLIITSDTSVAHLAGGMGKTTWLLLHQVPDWRWGLEGNSTFWYPTMRLFRQTERGNWNEVMERVARALEEMFPASTSRKINQLL